eukprot:5675711-Prymnesium_polylepis.1
MAQSMLMPSAADPAPSNVPALTPDAPGAPPPAALPPQPLLPATEVRWTPLLDFTNGNGLAASYRFLRE